jgi:sphingomyelin phosphodiesterase
MNASRVSVRVCVLLTLQLVELIFGQRANYFNYINMTNPDVSGMLRFLTDELQAAEDVGDRGFPFHFFFHIVMLNTHLIVWIMGHVLTGWDGTNPLLNPTNLCEPFH